MTRAPLDTAPSTAVATGEAVGAGADKLVSSGMDGPEVGAGIEGVGAGTGSAVGSPGALGAGAKILLVIFANAFAGPTPRRSSP